MEFRRPISGVPVISRFFGIVIFMNYNDPEPPHFHARYQDQEIMVEIQTGVVIGRMSKRALRMVLEWSDQHQEELLENWRLARWEAASEGDSTSAVGVGRMFLHVQAVRHLERYQLRIEFDNGVTKEIDLEGELHGEVFEPLRDPTMFSQVRLNPETGTIEWPNGADLAPEFLYEKGTSVGQAA